MSMWHFATSQWCRVAQAGSGGLPQVSDDHTYTVGMPIVNVRELSRRTSRVIGAVVRTGRPAVVTRGGRPIAVVSALDSDDLEDWVLAHAPEFVRGMREADRDLAAGRTVSLADYLARRRSSKASSAAARSRPATRGG